jgi:agmatine/peptidylarginine deiminase
MNTNQHQIVFPAEWAKQSGVQLTWPHRETDWKDSLDDVTACYMRIAREIVRREKLLVVCRDVQEVRRQLWTDGEIKSLAGRILFREIPSNDTWARDHGAIAVFADGKPYIYDFAFNGWGLKFAAAHDNQITGRLYAQKAFQPKVGYRSMKHFVLEGGSIETDGEGVILTTSQCLLSPNRNGFKSTAEMEERLRLIFEADTILRLDHGFLAGDDTDGHIDTLARFCNRRTIAYVRCDDPEDVHFEELRKMERELQSFRCPDGQPYRLVPLPMADAVMHGGERLPATYANFLIINGAVLLPFYGSPCDEIARQQLQRTFPDREVVGIDCRPLIRQHGSLHCITMQFPDGFLCA